MNSKSVIKPLYLFILTKKYMSVSQLRHIHFRIFVGVVQCIFACSCIAKCDMHLSTDK